MKERELFEKAIQALESLVESHGYTSYISDEEKEAEGEVIFARSTITAMKEALAQPAVASEQSTPCKEPVAWVVYSSAENDIVWTDKGKRLKQNTPLYTTPPTQCNCSQRPSRSDMTWVGLTEVEVNEVLGGDIRDEPNGLLEFVRAIEAKLKEKNT